jgi:pilus assembly protein TadC
VTALVAGLAAAAAVAAWPVAADPRRRLADLARTARCAPPRERSAVHPALLLTAALGVAAIVATGGTTTWLLVGAMAVLVLRRRSAAAPEDVALLVDLLASCLAAGVTPADAADATAAVATGPRGRSLLAVAGRLRAGEPPRDAWSVWSADPELAAAARACTRAAGSGTSVAAELTRAATRIRRARAALTQRRVAAAGVWIVMPLGLCFLPAFVLLGVVPIAVGLLERVG